MRALLHSSCIVALLALFVSVVQADESRTALTSGTLDALIVREAGLETLPETVDDELFLIRLSLDLIGRRPMSSEIADMLRDPPAQRRPRMVDRLLASHEYGRHWANYWSDTISFRVVPPAEVWVDYGPLEGWIAAQLNRNTPWDEVVRQLLASNGLIVDVPQTTFQSYHSGEPTKLASETSRIFLGVQIECAECHDHPFESWTMNQFHGMAAAFAKVKTTRAKGGAINGVTYEAKRKYKLREARQPDMKGREFQPAVFTGTTLDKTSPRSDLSRWVTGAGNPWFARAFVQRIWAELMGRGFYSSIDNLRDDEQPALEAVHAALAADFTASGFDVKHLLRVIVLSEAYQRRPLPGAATDLGPLAPATKMRLRGDEVADSLSQALGVNLAQAFESSDLTADSPRMIYTTPSERIAHRFGHDPSLGRTSSQPTMAQTLILMNGDELQREIDADPESGTQLARLLDEEANDRRAAHQLYLQTLSRQPTARELEILLDHIAAVGDRGEAFQDILWSLINSAEFLTRR